MLSPAVRNKKIDFCEHFKPIRTLNEGDMQGLYDQLINLDGQLYFKGIIDDSFMNGNLVDLTLSFLIADIADYITLAELYRLKCEIAKR